jgi:hypothetical protein
MKYEGEWEYDFQTAHRRQYWIIVKRKKELLQYR